MEKELAHHGKKGPGLQASVIKSILAKVESEKDNLESHRVAEDNISDLDNQAWVYVLYFREVLSIFTECPRSLVLSLDENV